MTAHTPEKSAELLCHRCGYDLRAHPPDGKCPECAASVAESARLAAIPLRPAWGQSDPRWRRRMLAGMWILVLLPLMDTLKAFEWASSVPVPTVFDFRATVRTLEDTFLSNLWVYQPLVFCVGVVLLFSKERGRRRSKLDWTRRWGVISSYVVLLLSAANVLIIAALVLAGITAIFHSMPLRYQPHVTQLFADLSSGYLRYGAYPGEISMIVLAAFSSIAILLACIPLFDALRSSGPKRLAAILLAPLALFSLINLAQAAWYLLGFSGVTPTDVTSLAVYFRPQSLINHIAGHPTFLNVPGSGLSALVVEAMKWCIVFAISVWLSLAQLAAWWKGRKASAA